MLNTYEGLTNTTGNTWESKEDVPVCQCDVIEDVYLEILKEEANGNVIIHRYSEIEEAEQKMHANYIKAHLDSQGEDM